MLDKMRRGQVNNTHCSGGAANHVKKKYNSEEEINNRSGSWLVSALF